MKILALNIGIGASVCLVRDGEILIAMEEERLSRIKGHMGFPDLALDYVKKNYGDVLSALDWVGIAGYKPSFLDKEAFLQNYERRASGKGASLTPGMSAKRLGGAISRVLSRRGQGSLAVFSGNNGSGDEFVFGRLKEFGVRREQIVHVKHHACHAAAAYYGLAKDINKEYVIFTLDGGGDRECSSVSVGHSGQLRQISSSPSGNSIGNIYSAITHLLGFVPHEHEYKLMGLSSYVPEKHCHDVRGILSAYLSLEPHDSLVFRRLTTERTTWMNVRLAKDLRRKRFDNIAGGLQKFTEDLVMEWVRRGIKATGIHDILLSGGVFMNVKLNKAIAEMQEVHSVNVFPSCGDESNSLGCAFWLHCNNGGGPLFAFESYTLGAEPTYDLNQAIREFQGVCEFRKVEKPNVTVAKLLAEGKIVARCSGPMEFGARALGNRSILADPISLDVVEEVNRMIKQRDFWMPFAPAVLFEDMHRYLHIPSSLPERVSPYMMFSFDTTELRRDMIAGIHRADKTARAQIVDRELYPEFHDILSVFKEITGRGAVLNTSFNIHGHPIVMGTMDAVKILTNSNLRYVLVDNVLMTKKY